MTNNRKQKNIPKGWRSARVEDIFEFVSTYSHSKSQMSYEVGDNDSVYNIHYGDIHSKYSKYIDLSKNNIPFLMDKGEIFKKEKFLNVGDLVMVDASEDYDGVGSSVEIRNLTNKKCVAGLHTFVLRDKTKSTVDGYRALLFRNEKVHNWLKRVSVYSKVFGITKASLQKTQLLLPPLPEQKQIVKILEAWDKCLEKLSRKIEIKKNIKKGLMQRLLTGAVRLNMFSGEWESVKLEDIVDFKNGKAHEKNITENGKYVVVNSKFISSDSRVVKYSNKNMSPLLKDDIVMVMSDVPNGKAIAKCFLIDENDKYTLNQRICSIKPKKDNSVFLFFILNRNKYFLQFDDGVKQTNLRKDDILDCQIKLPSKEEQIAIAKILTTADKEIEILEKKKKIIEDQKKYLLNNLVTGKIRIPEFVK